MDSTNIKVSNKQKVFTIAINNRSKEEIIEKSQQRKDIINIKNNKPKQKNEIFW